MATVARDFDLVREMKNPYNNRLRLVESPKHRGIKPTAQLFATTVATDPVLRQGFLPHDSEPNGRFVRGF